MRKIVISLLSLCFLQSPLAAAKVSPDEAQRLGADLTPVGAEAAGNADGTIPPWTGGVSTPPETFVKGKHEASPFPSDRPLFVISAENEAQYADYLTPGQAAMMAKYPETYNLPVYQTRRTAAYPEWVYEKLKANAVTAELIENGNGVRNSIATSPFPIPENGLQVIWNHILRFRGEQVSFVSAFATPQRNGAYTPVLTNYDYYFSYSEPGVELEEIDNKIFYLKTRILAPSGLSGTLNLIHETLDQVRSPRMAWRYVSGERRLRRSPNLAYDTALPNSEGFRTVDQKDMYNGAPNQYDWDLKGKREIYVPYNAYRLHQSGITADDIVRPGHINQELTRYERHRVWVVEGTLRVGLNHVYGKRVFYFDEDSWQILLTEEYDRDGNLWRVSEAHPVSFYSEPVFWTTLETTYDLKAGRYFIDGLDNEETPYNFNPGFGPRSFTASSVRQEARR